MKHEWFAVVVGSLVVACTAAPVGGVPGSDVRDESNATSVPANGNTSSGSSTAQPSTSQGTTTPDPTTPTPTPDASVPPPAPAANACSAEANANACFECCETQNPAAWDKSDQAFDTCVCATPGICKTACGNDFCAGGQPSAACEQCLGNAIQCEDVAKAACDADPACTAAIACFDASQCDNKQ